MTPWTVAYRLLHPWDFPEKNTGVGCHCLLQCMKVKSDSEVAQSCQTLCNPMDCSLQAPPSMGFSRQEYLSGLPLPSLLLMYNLYITKFTHCKFIHPMISSRLTKLNDHHIQILFFFKECFLLTLFTYEWHMEP